MDTKIFKKRDEVFEKYQPDILSIAGIVETAYLKGRIVAPSIYLSLYKHTGEEKYLVKFYRMAKSNNWLKMHGYPKRRRTHK